MKDVIETNKYVELTYEVIDQKSGQVLTSVEFPLGYVHGVNAVLSPQGSSSPSTSGMFPRSIVKSAPPS
jgi:hypothetical protein